VTHRREDVVADSGDVRPALAHLDGQGFRSSLGDFLSSRGERPFRVGQIAEWIFRRCVQDFEAMRTLPRTLRTDLEAAFRVHGLRLEQSTASADGARKYLFRTDESHPVESVRLPASDGTTYCLSVSCGCPLSCAFCASGRFFHRSLSSGEIMDQFLLMRALSQDTPPFGGVVLMGMGEPLVTWDTTRGFLAALRGLCKVGARRITVSTVGVPDGIEALAREFPQVKLAVSLHASRDELRRELMPYARTVSLEAIMHACRRYVELTHGRRITFEYVLLAGVNDSTADAQTLGALLKGLPAAVNLIPFNHFPGSSFVRPSGAEITAFAAALRRHFRGQVTLRRSLGAAAGAACGQLGVGRG
jgi:23S rRNA (adenine2503-C2)-methyltransferase